MNDLQITVRRASNGFVVMGDAMSDRYAAVDSWKWQVAVARTPQELASIVEVWAKGPPEAAE